MGTTRGPQPEAQTPGEGAARARAVVLLAVRRRKCGGQAVLRAELGGVQPGRGRSTGLRRPCAHCVRTPYAKCALLGRRCSRYAWAWMLSSVLVISIRCSAGTAAPDTSSPNRAPSSPRPTPATGRPWSRPGAPAQPPWVVVVPGLPADTATKTDDTAQPRDERPAVVRCGQRPQPLTEPAAEHPINGQRPRPPGTTVYPHQLRHSRVQRRVGHRHHLREDDRVPPQDPPPFQITTASPPAT